jgi:hypothetical protein
MSDISKCSNDSCPLRKKCYRFTSLSNSEWQAYSDFRYDFENKECKYFRDIKLEDDLREEFTKGITTPLKREKK